MADVLLYEAVGQVRAFLQAGNYSDALARARHILHFYPKHIETYTVLAQVSLATNDLAGANDLLRRVLSADPENIIALSGMGLISEVQDKYDEALWYLERAYEIQPSNDELRSELLRIREMYYGTTPSRVELTSGALARVYARQAQFAQAINEFRRLLRNDSKRYDARVGLAETLYRAGRTDEAAQIAQSVMEDAPYALKPNLILGALWTENAVPEGQEYLQRAHQLDPEHRVARDLLGEQFDGTQAPRLPAFGETATQTVTAVLPEPEPSFDLFASDGETARAVRLLSEIEREQAADSAAEEPLFADQDTIDRVETEASETPTPVSESQAAAEFTAPVESSPAQDTTSVALSTPPAEPVAEPAAPPQPTPNPSSALEEILEAERQKKLEEKPAEPVAPPPAPKKLPTLSERLARKGGEGLSADTIAAAAAALASSIAQDKSSQPAPTRRAHPALPKVRPVIKSAQDKLPGWLRISATPSNASASFDAPAATITPESKSEPDRPDWLVQAEAASVQENTSAPGDAVLPDWLNAPASSVNVKPSVETPSAQVIPAWLGNQHQIETPPVASTPALESANTAAPAQALPDWLRDESDAQQEPTAASASPAVAESASSSVAESTPTQPEQSAPSEELPALSTQPQTEATSTAATVQEPSAEIETASILPVEPGQVVPERSTTQSLPDSGTMLQMARDKRAAGDLKGALDLYERVMHRRPNYLEQVTADLQEIVQGGGAPTSANRLLGEAYAMVGRFKESLEQYRIAMGK